MKKILFTIVAKHYKIVNKFKRKNLLKEKKLYNNICISFLGLL